MPSMPLVARFARLFLADAVRRLAEDCGAPPGGRL